jgi:hypothetical protein
MLLRRVMCDKFNLNNDGLGAVDEGNEMLFWLFGLKLDCCRKNKHNQFI